LDAAAGSDNLGGDLVASAVPVGSGGRLAGVALVQKRPVAAARTAPAGGALGRLRLDARLRTLAQILLHGEAKARDNCATVNPRFQAATNAT
jgi:hypothetical protein